MNSLLVSVISAVNSLAAIVVIIAGILGGMVLFQQGRGDIVIGAVFGGIAGLIVASMVFGTIAILIKIEEHLKKLALAAKQTSESGQSLS